MARRWQYTAVVFGLVAVATTWSCSPGESVLTQIPDSIRLAVSEPTEVTAVRIHSTDHGSSERIGQPVRLNADQIAELQPLFRRGGASVGVPACIPRPGIRFKFSKGSRIVKADICLSCARALFQEQGSKNSGAANFDNVKPQMVAFIKTVFVNDPEIQRLDPNAHPDFERP